MAQALGLTPVGVFGVLLRGKQAGKIAAILPIMERLQQELGFFVSAPLKATVRRLAGE